MDTASTDLWQLGTPQKAVFDSAYSPTRAMVTDTVNPYVVNNDSWFEIMIPTMSNLIVTFKHRYDTDTLKDGGFVEVSEDMGLNWTDIAQVNTLFPYPVQLNLFNMYDTLDSIANGHIGFSGNSGGWVCSQILWISMLPVKVVSDTTLFRFHFISDSVDTGKDGWMIDDIQLDYCDLGGSVEELEQEAELVVYPNPTTGLVRIEGRSSSTDGIVVLDVMGRNVPTTGIYTVGAKKFLNLSPLTDGVYFLKTGQSVKKVILKH